MGFELLSCGKTRKTNIIEKFKILNTKHYKNKFNMLQNAVGLLKF